MSTLLDSHRAIAYVTPVGVQLDIETVEVNLDETQSPYGEARIVCQLPDEATQKLLDLRTTPLRLQLRLRQDFASAWSVATLTAAGHGSMATLTAELGGLPLSTVYQRFSTPWNASGRRPSTSRWFDLMVSERSIDHKAAQLTLVAYTDEALMLSDALVATTVLNPGTTSVRSIAEQLLARVGAVLTPGPDDGTVEADATLWRPGMTAWDYFAPLAQAANLRLWCDERRRWHLTEVRPTAEGAITVNPTATLTAVTDTMTVTGDEWYDAVVIRYRWVDAFDLNQERYDAAGAASPRNVLLIEHDTPYPGAGAAAGILSRAQGRGRVLEVEAVSDYTAQPGMPATITPPATDAQTGFVSSVTWRLPDAEMSISTRGLVDTPATSWLFVPAGVAWNDIPAGVSWNTYTPELIGA